MKLEDLFPGSFSAEHFIDGPARLTISRIEPIVFDEDGESKQKGKMSFEEVSNYWVFGKEAAGELAEQISSSETDDWIGHEIELRQDRTRFKGKLVPCVRASFTDLAPKRKGKGAAQAALPEPDPQSDELAELERRIAEMKGRGAKVPA